MDRELWWLVAVLVTGVIFGCAAIPARRRWGRRGLLVAAALVAMAAVAAGRAWMGPAGDDVFTYFRVLVMSVVVAAVAGSIVADRMVKRSTLPDPLVEIGMCATGFAGGAMVGAWLSLMGVAIG